MLGKLILTTGFVLANVGFQRWLESKQGRKWRSLLQKQALGLVGQTRTAEEAVESVMDELLRDAKRLPAQARRTIDRLAALDLRGTRPAPLGIPLAAASIGILVGGSLMYLFDPEKGQQRRVMRRSRLLQSRNAISHKILGTATDATNRAQGFLARLRNWLHPEEISDEKLVERIRSVMGHVIERPSAIRVQSNQGQITLTGLIPAPEANKLVACVSAIRGVHGVRNELQLKGNGVAEPHPDVATVH